MNDSKMTGCKCRQDKSIYLREQTQCHEKDRNVTRTISRVGGLDDKDREGYMYDLARGNGGWTKRWTRASREGRWRRRLQRRLWLAGYCVTGVGGRVRWESSSREEERRMRTLGGSPPIQSDWTLFCL